MIAMTHNGFATTIGKKPHDSQRADGERYAVVPCGLFHEVRLRRYAGGFLKSDQLIAALPCEKEADDLARFLTEKGNDDAVYSFDD